MRASNDTDLLQWTVHPLKRSRPAALMVTGVVAAIPLFVYWVYEDPYMALIAFLVMFFSLRSFYFPTRYTLDAEGVICACFPFRLRRPWEAFKSYYASGGAVRLSTFSTPSRLDAHRGVLLRYEGSGERIIEFLKNRIPAAMDRDDGKEA